MSLGVFLIAVFIFSIIVIIVNVFLIRKNKEESDFTRLLGGVLVFIGSGILLVFREKAAETLTMTNEILIENAGFSVTEIGLGFLILIVIIAIMKAIRN